MGDKGFETEDSAVQDFLYVVPSCTVNHLVMSWNSKNEWHNSSCIKVGMKNLPFRSLEEKLLMGSFCFLSSCRQILEEHRKNCERQGKYVEAEIAKNRLEELRQHEENRRREAMRSRQIAERLGVEEAHMLEFQQFNALWDKRMAEFEQKSADLDEAMKERHGTELMEYIRNAQSEPLRKPKFSKELLNLRKIQQTLAKQKEYAGRSIYSVQLVIAFLQGLPHTTNKSVNPQASKHL